MAAEVRSLWVCCACQAMTATCGTALMQLEETEAMSVWNRWSRSSWGQAAAPETSYLPALLVPDDVGDLWVHLRQGSIILQQLLPLSSCKAGQEGGSTTKSSRRLLLRTAAAAVLVS